jgi:hypothetical protein
MQLSERDKRDLRLIAIKALGLIVLVLILLAGYVMVYRDGVMNERKRNAGQVERLGQRIKHLEADSVYMRELIFKP